MGASPKRGGPRFSFRSPPGFTLVELMIVVAILGILATIAVPTFLRMRERARTAEARSNLGAIRVVQFGFFAEYARYIGNQPYTPDRTLTPAAKLPWDPDTRFTLLGFAPEGDVYYSYELAGPDESPSAFTARARSDLDENGDWSVWATNNLAPDLMHSGDQF